MPDYQGGNVAEMNVDEETAVVISQDEVSHLSPESALEHKDRLIEQLRAENAVLRARQKEILQSTSWKVTVPIRIAGQKVPQKVKDSARVFLKAGVQTAKATKRTIENEGWEALLRKSIDLVSLSESSSRSLRFNSAKEARWIKRLEQSQAAKQVLKTPPLVSIILPTRDRAKLVIVAIESILAQTYHNWELLVVDDGSSDNTVELLEQTYDDPRIRILQSGGQGVCVARNCGLQEATGELVAYLDSDNTWTTRYLELMTIAMEDSTHDSAYAVLKCINQKPTIYRQKKFNYSDLKTKNYIDLNVFMHRRSLLEAIGEFDINLKRMVDWDLILRITENQSVTFAPFIGAIYDSGPSTDRITNKESLSYLDVVRDKHWTRWDEVQSAIGERDPDLVSIIICVFNQPELTRACLDSIFLHQAGADFEVIVVDNGSKKPTRKALTKLAKTYPKIKLVRNPENFNFSLGNNIGFRHSKGTRVVFLNNDTVVSPEWLGSLIRPLYDPTVKGVQPKLLYPDSTIQGVGITFSEHSQMGYPIYAHQRHDLPATQRQRRFSAITAACMAIRAEDFAAVRGFDPLFTNGQEDVDLCLRIGHGEAVFEYVPDSLVIHHEGKSKGRTARIEQNRRLFVDRWKSQKLPTDRAYYAADGIKVASYSIDSPDWQDADLAAFQPNLDIPVLERTVPTYASLFKGKTIAIKIGCPKVSEKDNWGDYHFAVALAQCFIKRGVNARIDFLPMWYKSARDGDINFVLRGLSQFKPASKSLNIMWLISHPDKVSDEEIRLFDHVFVASSSYVELLRDKCLNNCEVLLQCTDTNRFYRRLNSSQDKHDLLFVANSRKVQRQVPNEAQKFELQLSIFGKDWNNLAPAHWIQGESIANRDLPDYYSNATVVLNDHWQDMQASGFISNRIFDALACERPVVSDEIAGIPSDIIEGVTFFSDENPFDMAIQQARTLSTQGQEVLHKVAEVVRTKHSFESRSEKILQVISAKLVKTRNDTATSAVMGVCPPASNQ